MNSNNASLFQDDTFNTFVAEFDTEKVNSFNVNTSNKTEQGDTLEAEVERLKEQVKRANLEKAEMTSKFEKLSAICRSQRQEIQELKQSLAATPLPNKSGQQKLESGRKSTETSSWQPFADKMEQQASPSCNTPPQSVRTSLAQGASQSTSSSWGFDGQGFRAVSSAGGQPSTHNSQQSVRRKSVDSQSKTQPAGWAGF
ncbi:unnamed protein product [Linum tenue]|uniref:non-specific serine/threonine protein kinase n=1 Tax=Linum tenue TaxID=586396 RepID=A0AAV0R451_9ROSI|nr:unnamed protein product [Linum tenue]